MKILLVLALILAACSGGGGSSDKGPPTTPPRTNPDPEPRPEPEPTPPDNGDSLQLYKPEFKPLTTRTFELTEDEIPIVDDYLKYLQGIALNWETSIDGGFIPELFLRQWTNDNITYVDETEGKVKGIEKLEAIRMAMLDRCPILNDPKYNSPLTVHWNERDDKVGGSYKATEVHLSEFIHGDATVELRYHGSLFPWLSSTMWISGKMALWDYPDQTSAESGNPWGIDWTFIHEWGHHLMFSVSINQGKNSHSTWEMSESFAETFKLACSESYLDRPDRARNLYDDIVNDKDYLIESLSEKTNLINGTHYNIRSMEYCIAHEKHLGRFDSNQFTTALIESLKCINGRKEVPRLWPIYFDDGSFAQAPWLGGGNKDNRRLNAHQPFLITRKEFLGCFRKHYDCGLANDLIDADIEGKSKGEW